MKKIVFLVIFTFIYLFSTEHKPYWLNGDKIPYRYYGIKGAFLHKNGIHYTINLASNLAKKELIKTLDRNRNLTNDTKLELMKNMKTKQYKSDNGRVYIFVYIDQYLK